MTAASAPNISPCPESATLLQGRGRWWAHPLGLPKQKEEGANGFEKTLAASTCCLISWSSDQGLVLHLHADLRLALTFPSTWDPTLTPQVDSVATLQPGLCITVPARLLTAAGLTPSLARLSAPGGQAPLHLVGCSARVLGWTRHK